MSRIAEDPAGRYAEAVMTVLAEEFVSLRHDTYTEKIVRNAIIRHAQNPDEPFETSIDLTRNWRLHREDAFRERWRVKIGCHKDNWTEDDIRFSDSVNRKLDAIRVET